MRIVLDTSVLVAGLRSRQGASNLLLQKVATERLVPMATTALFLEYEDVLMRAEHRIAAKMTEGDVSAFLAAFAAACSPVEVHFRWRPQLGDPSDELVLEAAVNGMADAIVTHNVRDFTNVARRFELSVLTPRDCLKELSQ